MKRINLIKAVCLSMTAIACITLSTAASAAVVEVKELNMGTDGQPMAYEPALVRIAPGDSVHFVAADKNHGVESIPGMLPDGATPIAGAPSEDHVIKFDKPGVYGYRCKPHYAMGMVGLVVVGKPVNEAAAKTALDSGMPPFAKNKLAKAFTDLDGK